MLSYKKMSLFDATIGGILVHGCNAQGVWGSGIAVPFKQKFPRAWKQYNDYCLMMLEDDKKFGAVGTSFITNYENGYNVGCLITSFSYGHDKDSPEKIALQTILALDNFYKEYVYEGHVNTTIYSNKFNSGLFNVPWEKTEKALEYFVKRYNLNWVVCDINL